MRPGVPPQFFKEGKKKSKSCQKRRNEKNNVYFSLKWFVSWAWWSTPVTSVLQMQEDCCKSETRRQMEGRAGSAGKSTCCISARIWVQGLSTHRSWTRLHVCLWAQHYGISASVRGPVSKEWLRKWKSMRTSVLLWPLQVHRRTYLHTHTCTYISIHTIHIEKCKKNNLKGWLHG